MIVTSKEKLKGTNRKNITSVKTDRGCLWELDSTHLYRLLYKFGKVTEINWSTAYCFFHLLCSQTKIFMSSCWIFSAESCVNARGFYNWFLGCWQYKVCWNVATFTVIQNAQIHISALAYIVSHNRQQNTNYTTLIYKVVSKTSKHFLKCSLIRHLMQYQRFLKKCRVPPWKKEVNRLEIKAYMLK